MTTVEKSITFVISFLSLLLMNMPNIAKASPIFFINDEAGWTVAAGGATQVEFFETSASNIALANEIISPPANRQNLATTVLTFDTINTPVSPSFTIHSLDAPGFHYRDEFPDVGEGLIFNPLDYDANDWDVVFSGAPILAFGVNLISSDNSTGESFSVFGQNGLIGSTMGIPDGSHSVIFLGVISDEPITRVVFDENSSDGDNIGIADLQFSAVPIPSSIMLLGPALLAIGLHLRRNRRI